MTDHEKRPSPSPPPTPDEARGTNAIVLAITIVGLIVTAIVVWMVSR